MNAPSPLSGASEPLALAVSVNGHALSPAVAILSVSIDHSVGVAPTADVGFSAEDPVVSVGDGVEIRAGYGAQSISLFFGRVQQVGFEFSTASGEVRRFSCLGAVPTGTPAAAPVLTLTYGQDVTGAELANPTEDTSAATTGSIRFRGGALVLPGDQVSLAGFPPPFSGSVPMGGVSHRIADGDWTTTIKLGLPPPAADIVLADAHGNRIQLDAQGISLHSAGAIAVNGLSVNLTAQTALVARGNASAELSASGETIVRGAMVRIN